MASNQPEVIGMTDKKVKSKEGKTFTFETEFQEEMTNKYGLTGLEWKDLESENKQQDPKRK